MSRRSFLTASGLAAGAAMAGSGGTHVAANEKGNAVSSDAEPSKLPIYEPNVEFSIVHPMRPEWNIDWGYNHDSDIVVYRGRYICVWNGNPQSDHEGRDGQLNYIGVSDDFEEWTRPVAAFGRENGAVNPVEDSLREWQPNFINFHDRKLFCNWKSDRHSERSRHWMSISEDGLHWTNRELPLYPEGHEDTRAFPTTHGLLTRDDVMLFPVSMAKSGGMTELGVALRSEDGGETWEFGEPLEAATLSEIGEDPADYDGIDKICLWEPVFYEHSDGRIGCLVRHLQRRRVVVDEDGKERREAVRIKPEHTVLYCESHDKGKTWTKAWPIEVETVSSREMAISGIGTPDGLIMAANDWPSGIPDYVRDRQHLAMFVSPTGDPNLLLPGPIVQRRGGASHYPNGCVHNGALYLSYSHGNNPIRGVYATRTEPLPDFSRPFLMPRGRGPKIDFYDGKAYLPDAAACLSLVLTKESTEAGTLRLRFRAKAESTDRFWVLPLLTAGGKTRNDLLLGINMNSDVLVKSGNEEAKLGRIPLNTWYDFEVTLGQESFTVACEGLSTCEMPTRVLRKLCFGGLYYEPVVEPRNTAFHVDLESIELEGV